MVDSPARTFLAGDYVVTHNTTLMAQYMILYIALYGEIPGLTNIRYALYVSDSMENGVKKMRLRLEQMWDQSPFLREYIPTARFTDVRWYFENADGHKFVVTGHGAKTGVRGTVELNTRPQLAILDDLISDEDARSPTVIASVEDTVYKAITYALHPKNNIIIWCGTPFNQKDPLYKAVESGAWAVNAFPIAEKFPCAREEFRGSWEDRFSYDYVKASYETAVKTGKIAAFNQELMLRIMSDEDRSVLDSDIGWYKLDNVIKNKHRFNFYITTDFATTTKESGDFSVLAVWAYNNVGDWLWCDGVVKRQLMNQNVDDLFRLAQIYKPQQVGVEISGQQKGFVSWIQDQMMVRNVYFPLASDHNSNEPGIRPNTNKVQRFNTGAVPLFKARKIYFPIEKKGSPEIAEYLDEISLASPGGFRSKHDDCLDTISMLQNLKPWKPSEEAPLVQKESGIWEPDLEDNIEDSLSSYVV
jgi:phage terminase large subunit-like protein